MISQRDQVIHCRGGEVSIVFGLYSAMQTAEKKIRVLVGLLNGGLAAAGGAGKWKIGGKKI